MASNSIGKIFRITTFGESHGKAIGVVIDGCPAEIELTVEDICEQLAYRAPGKNPYTSPRQEKDHAEILSGVFEGKTTGAPICILIPNKDADSSKYESMKNLMRPGHANFTYLEKYGIFDYRGGGRASARETAARVAAGAVAKKLLLKVGIHVTAHIKSIGTITAMPLQESYQSLREKTYTNPVYCPDDASAEAMMVDIEKAQEEGDSLGGVVECIAFNLPIGLGDPVYEKLEANLAKAMLSLPATKGFEIGKGFEAAKMNGSEHNDAFIEKKGRPTPKTNTAGGTLGGISTGQPLIIHVAFKPPSSIKKAQKTVDLQGGEKNFQLPEGSRHDPCVAIRAVPVVEAMMALVLADAYLMNRVAKL